MKAELPLVAGFQQLRVHTAPGVLVQRPHVAPEAARLLRRAATCELIRPYHGAVVHGDMAGDLGAVYRGDTPRPDLTMVTVAAVLRAAGRTVTVHDLNARAETAHPVGARTPGVRLVKVQLPTWQEDLAFARDLAARDPDCPVVLFGATVSHLPGAGEELAVHGDAPTALGELFECGEVDIGAAYEAFPLERYRAADGVLRVHLQSSRGCDRTCLYCPYIRTLGRWSGRSVDGFRQDTAHLINLGVDEIQLRDQDFPSDLSHALDMASVMRQAGNRLRWSVEGNLDRFVPPLLAELPGDGRTEVIVGLESADPAVLKSARRKVLRDTEELVTRVREAGLRVRGLFVLGLPQDSWAGTLATVRLAIDLQLDAVQFNVYAPLPGERFGNAEIASVHDYVPLHNHFLYRTCDSMTQKEVRLAAGLANRAFFAHQTGDLEERDRALGKIHRRMEGH